MYTADNVFTNLLTEDTAYLLGYTYADGCVADNNALIYSSIDYQLIDTVRDVMKSNSPIKNKTGKQTGSYGNSKDSYRLEICRKRICDTLRTIGVKSPDFFPDMYRGTPYMAHYIRGVFDGDGCISIQNSGGHRKKCTWNIILHKDVIAKFQTELSIVVPQSISIQKSRTDHMYYLKNSSLSGACVLADYLYQDATRYLVRKHEKFLQVRAYVGRPT